ncbi:3-deoxy-manno-octulosonate cytidylyltransferase [Ferrigenium kumadai]|uniref:3-deoxy-manno-octulosonate cytidylyltransferase n=1 Tax=Ferrigenium kumadai TaxID=1682490 RepID=A0AAN1SYD4_9PROT|nr:3-deoxy-manno-octulosonate cytidylyltransferase [Ferrigenium kumadai]BBI99252.1 3-deoxy-manno-octulosonate cytidylyltransferase [Ferrigenium kumadai]
MVAFHVVIPARHASTRLPGKPLLPIAGKPMVVRVAEQAAQSGAQQIWIATDHHAIAGVVHEHGFKACLTKDTHASGTDRIAEVVEQQGWTDETIVVNVQGDEPLMPPALVRAVAEHLHAHPECAIATACHAIHDEAALRNPNIVKTVLDKHGNALYFSRAPIPYPRDAFAAQQPLPQDMPVLRHIGIYAYRVSFLRAYGRLAPAAIEQFEALEQLRALYHGYKIGVFVAEEAPPSGVDTEQDLQVARQIFEKRTNGGTTK